MDKQDQKLHQIGSIADSEALGSPLFIVHVGLLFCAAVSILVLFDQWALPALIAGYSLMFVLEKWGAAAAFRAGKGQTLPVILFLLFARATGYNLIIVYVWTLDGAIFEMAALALIVASTINIMVHHPTYLVNMACVVVPKWLTFLTLSALIYRDYGPSAEFLASLVTIACITPYFYLSLVQAHRRWSDLSETKRELIQSQRLEGMGKVAGGVSHDFNNILSVVSGSLQLLENTKGDDERQRLIRVAERAIEHGSTLNRRLVALGKRSPLRPQSVDLRVAVAEFKAFAERVLPESIAIETDAPQAVFVRADPGMLQSAMLNVALNAKAAMPDGGTLTVTAHPDLVHGNGTRFAVISMTDTGTGMSAETADRAFEAFFTTREVGGGSGLGLPMVKGFAEQSKGRVTLTSALGQGTSIEIFLPITDAADTEDTPKVDTELWLHNKGLKPRILLVEDNPQLLGLLSLKLERDGFVVVPCGSGDEALSVLDSQDGFDIVVSDVVMPGTVQGAHLLAELRARGLSTPFIAMSGYTDLKDGTGSTVISEADIFLEKPFDLDRFSGEIERLLVQSALRS